MVRQVPPRRASAPAASLPRVRLSGEDAPRGRPLRAIAPAASPPLAALLACALLACALLACALLALAGCAAEAPSPQAPPPPAPLPELVQAQPAPGMVWMPGCWHWDGEGYVWLPGHWEAPPAGRTAEPAAPP